MIPLPRILIGYGVMMSNSNPKDKMEVDRLDRIGEWQMEWDLRVGMKMQWGWVNLVGQTI